MPSKGFNLQTTDKYRGHTRTLLRREKAMRVPSGDQSGSQSSAASNVRRVVASRLRSQSQMSLSRLGIQPQESDTGVIGRQRLWLAWFEDWQWRALCLPLPIEPDEAVTHGHGVVREGSCVRDGEAGELRDLGRAEAAHQRDGVARELQAIGVDFLSDNERTVTDEEEIPIRKPDDTSAGIASKMPTPVGRESRGVLVIESSEPHVDCAISVSLHEIQEAAAVDKNCGDESPISRPDSVVAGAIAPPAADTGYNGPSPLAGAKTTIPSSRFHVPPIAFRRVGDRPEIAARRVYPLQLALGEKRQHATVGRPEWKRGIRSAPPSGCWRCQRIQRAHPEKAFPIRACRDECDAPPVWWHRDEPWKRLQTSHLRAPGSRSEPTSADSGDSAKCTPAMAARPTRAPPATAQGERLRRVQVARYGC